MVLGASSGRSGRSGRLVLLDEVAREYAFLLHTALVDIFAGIPVGILLLSNSDDLAYIELQVVVMARVILEDGLDLEHGDAAVCRSDAREGELDDAGQARCKTRDWKSTV
jgi:hypothetical protein